MRFRTATPADVDPMIAIVNSAYRGTEGKTGWTTESHLVGGARAERDEILAMMAKPDVRFELAEDEGLLGSVYLRREPPATCYLGMLSVDPDRQAAGVGRALIAHAEDVARAWDCNAIRISVIEVRHELLDYYARRGFARTGRVEPFPDTPRTPLKVPGLKLVEMVKRLS